MVENCGKGFIAIKREKDGKALLQAFPARCKSWNCPRCADKKSREYGRRIDASFKNVQLYFYTFTFRHGRSSREVWAEASGAWNLLLTKIHKRYGGFRYVKILECHTQSNYPHYHVLSTRLVSARWLGHALIASGFGYQCRISRVNSQGVSGYLRKYLGKSWPRADAQQIRTGLGLRVVTFSRDAGICAVHNGGWSYVGFSPDRSRAILLLLMGATHYSGMDWYADRRQLTKDCPSIECCIPPPCPIRLRPEYKLPTHMLMPSWFERQQLIDDLGIRRHKQVP